MNSVCRSLWRPACAAQTIYQTLLAISCAAVALALFFPVYEYFELYRGPIKPYKFEPSAQLAYPQTPAPPAPVKEPAAATTTVPGAGEVPATTTTVPTAPAGTPAPGKEGAQAENSIQESSTAQKTPRPGWAMHPVAVNRPASDR